MTVQFYPVILSGGSGTRLWPMSRKLLPKQFLALTSEHTLFQETALRVQGIEGCVAPIVVCNDEQRFLAAGQLREIGIEAASMILEPVGRNTAPAIAAAALSALDNDPHAVLLVLPSDHTITRPDAFRKDAMVALELARRDFLATFGIVPDAPETGYGYIERGTPVEGMPGCWKVASFREKPDRATAQSFIASGGFFWNSGMFAFSASRYLEELQRLRPEIVAAVRQAYSGSARDLDFVRLDREAFARSPSDSIDYAVMEKTSAAAVVAADMGWSDVGSWAALWQLGDKDARGNVTRGATQLHDVSGSYVRAESKLVCLLGVEDLVVVETDDAVLISKRSRAEQVKDIVAQLEKEKRTEHIAHTRVYRPWGYYEGIDAGERFQVKRLMVKPRQAISLQLHRKRAEHWIVVSGTATVTRGEQTFDVPENHSTFIPLGVKHRLDNRTDAALYLIEVQSGSYLGEDDIERFDDRYGRN